MVERYPIAYPTSFFLDIFIVIWIHRNLFSGIWTKKYGGRNVISLERKGHEISFLPCWDVTLPSTYVLVLLLNNSVLLQ